MKSHEFIQAAADLFGALAGAQDTAAEPVQANRAVLVAVEPETDDQAETSVFIAPLQQKIELLKKSVGVDNFYDNQESQSDQTDDLAVIKRLSGINPVATDEAASDEPLDV